MPGLNGMKAAARGRPRDPQTDRAILNAALRMLGEEGFDRMSIDAVAAAAGVGKTTVYRRFRDKADLASAAVAELTDWGGLPDTGDARQDLITLMQNFHRYLSGSRGMGTIGTLLVEQRHCPELIRLFRKRIIRPRRKLIAQVIERGIQRGQIRAGADIDLVVDLLAGSYFARYLAGLPAGNDWARKMVDTVWQGLRR